MNLAKFLTVLFLQNTFGRLFLLLAFHKQPLEVFYEKKVFLKISQNSQENSSVRVSFFIKLQASGLQRYKKRNSGIGVFLWILRNFQGHLFYRTPLDDCFLLFPATSLKWGIASSVWKISDEYSLSRNTNLRSTIQVYHFIFGSINVQCMLSLAYTVYYQKQPTE